MDILGRVATFAALAFIIYGFTVEARRSDENADLLARIQEGRRAALITVCRTSNEQRAADRAILQQFDVEIPGGLRAIDCKALLNDGNTGKP